MACIITRAISSKKEKKFNHRRTRILSVIDNEVKKNSRGKSSVGQNRYTVGKQGENSRENRFFESTSSFYQPGKRRGNGRISKPAESRKVEARLPDVDEHWTHTRARARVASVKSTTLVISELDCRARAMGAFSNPSRGCENHLAESCIRVKF